MELTIIILTIAVFFLISCLYHSIKLLKHDISIITKMLLQITNNQRKFKSEEEIQKFIEDLF